MSPDIRDDTRAFDGPFDKQMVRRSNREAVGLLRDDLCVRVPGAEGDKTYGEMREVEAGPTDRGRRWVHTYDKVPGSLPVSFDAGLRALWVSPLGWRVLMAYVRDDPTYGFEATIFAPDGKIHAEESGIEELDVWLDAMLP